MKTKGGEVSSGKSDMPAAAATRATSDTGPSSSEVSPKVGEEKAETALETVPDPEEVKENEEEKKRIRM